MTKSPKVLAGFGVKMKITSWLAKNLENVGE